MSDPREVDEEVSDERLMRWMLCSSTAEDFTRYEIFLMVKEIQYRRSLHARCQDVRREEWRDIESAPKNRTWILFWIEGTYLKIHDGIRIGYFDQCGPIGWVPVVHATILRKENVKYWQPLPLPPDTRGSGDD